MSASGYIPGSASMLQQLQEACHHAHLLAVASAAWWHPIRLELGATTKHFSHFETNKTNTDKSYQHTKHV